jgi:hypothetical protein
VSDSAAAALPTAGLTALALASTSPPAGPDEVISFDRAPGAGIYTLNLFDELQRMNAANALARLVRLLEARTLTAPIELEMTWQAIQFAIDALMTRTISGKAVLIRSQQARRRRQRRLVARVDQPARPPRGDVLVPCLPSSGANARRSASMSWLSCFVSSGAPLNRSR